MTVPAGHSHALLLLSLRLVLCSSQSCINLVPSPHKIVPCVAHDQISPDGGGAVYSLVMGGSPK